MINITYDHALLTGYSKGLKQIDDSVIAECKRDLHILSDTDKYQEEDESFEENQEIVEISEPPNKAQGSKRIWLYASFFLALIIIGYLVFNFGWRKPAVVDIREKIVSLKNSGSEKESAKSEDVIKGVVDGEKASEKDQKPSTIDQEKLDEPGEEASLSEIEGDQQTADPAHSEDTLLFAQGKKIIHFKHNSMRLSDEAYEVLDQIVDFGTSNQVPKIIVEGYTDSLGHPEYNKSLSRRRAEVIKKYLVDKGIPAEKIETVGMGPENPIASNETFEGRKLNRRIEIRFKVK